MKRWLIIFLIILIFPITLFFSHALLHSSPDNNLKVSSFKENHSKDIGSAAKNNEVGKVALFKTPTLKEQPRDTLVSEGILPIHHWKNSKGTPVYFVPTEGLPMVDVFISFDAGSARDGEKFGIADLTLDILDEGSKNLNADEIADKFESLGAQYNAGVDRDKARIEVRSLANPDLLNPAIDTLAEVLSLPTFTEMSLQQHKNQVLVELQKNLQEPSIIAMQTFLKGIYGTHPYAHFISGTLESIPKITRNDLIAFHKRYYVAKNMTITIVGGLHRDRAREISEKLANKLEVGEIPEALPSVAKLEQASESRLAFPSTQTHILMGQPCETLPDKDYFALMMGNYILGEGSLVSRLFDEIREKRGLAYVATSSMQGLKRPGPFIVRLQTKSESAQESIKVIQAATKEFIDKGPTNEELIAAKKGVIAGFPLKIGSNYKIAELISELSFYGFPMDFLNTYQANVEKLTIQEINDVFKRRIDPNKMVLVVVGNGK